jgi:hypothetical protein
MTWVEEVHLPSWADLGDINIAPKIALQADGERTPVEVVARPNDVARAFWRDPTGCRWRIPHDWQRRRVRLPGSEILAAQQIPEEVAEAFGGATVSVNYHPGSLCCLPDAYRFRDKAGSRWPVRKRDCVVLGFGAVSEAHA